MTIYEVIQGIWKRVGGLGAQTEPGNMLARSCVRNGNRMPRNLDASPAVVVDYVVLLGLSVYTYCVNRCRQRYMGEVHGL